MLKALLTTVLLGAFLVAMTFAIWPPEAPSNAARLAQSLGYVLLAVESLAAAGGIAFLALAFPRVGTTGISRPLALGVYIGIAFLLLDWWPQAHLRVLAGTPALETARPVLWQAIYGFHDTVMLVGAVLAFFFARVQAGQTTRAERLDGRRRLWSGWKFAILAVLVAAISLPLTSILYAALRLPSGRAPAGWLLAGVLLNTAITRLALGAGVAFVILAWPLVRRSSAPRGLTLLVYLSIAWCLLSWLPYQQIDFLIGYAVYPQIGLSYGFHLTLILAAAVLAIFFYRVTHASSSAEDGRPAGRLAPEGSR